MENKVFQDNLAIIEKYDAKLAQSIKNTVITSYMILAKTDADEYNFIYKTTPLHDTHGAEKEAKDIVKNISNINVENSIVIIFGLGLGYLLDEAASAAKGKVILFEPSLEILKTTLEIAELQTILSKKNVFLCADMEKLSGYIKTLANKETQITISFLNSYRQLFGERLNEVAQAAQYSQGEEQAVENTLKVIGKLAVVNTFKNLKHLKETATITELTGHFKKKPALIVSAGPSLSKNIDFIKENQNKMVIFCIGAARRLLEKHGIVPDFLCIVEPRGTKGQYEGVDLSNDNLILEPSVHFDIFEQKAKNKFLYPSKGNFLNDWLCKNLKISNNDLPTAGTVSYEALNCAKLMGCEPLILIGQDLAYTDGRCYAQGSAYNELVCELDPETQEYKIFPKDKERYKIELFGKDSGLTPERLEVCVEEHLEFLNKNLMTVKGQSGEPLPTQNGYALFIKYFESFASDNPSRSLINASSGGAQIEGFKNIPLQNIDLKEEFDKTVGTIKTKYNITSLKEGIAKEKLLMLSAIEEIYSVLHPLILKMAKEFRPKNIEKFREKFYSCMRQYVDKYVNKSLPVYFAAYEGVHNIFSLPYGPGEFFGVTDCIGKNITELVNICEELEESGLFG